MARLYTHSTHTPTPVHSIFTDFSHSLHTHSTETSRRLCKKEHTQIN
ncbi:MAG: hypothetical protein RIE73_17655 [Coleofasciculus sp. C1-SOL-03]